MFQFFHLIPSLTAYENVAVPMEIAGVAGSRAARASSCSSEVGLTGRAHHYPSQLSGGEQQRVALARALGQRPADRARRRTDRQPRQPPTGATSWICCATIHAARGTTIVLVTHDAELAAMADARLVLRDGRVTVDEPRLAYRQAVQPE